MSASEDRGTGTRMTGRVKDCSTPAHVRTTVQTRRGWTGRGWTILKGGNREGVLTTARERDWLWGFEGWRRCLIER